MALAGVETLGAALGGVTACSLLSPPTFPTPAFCLSVSFFCRTRGPPQGLGPGACLQSPKVGASQQGSWDLCPPRPPFFFLLTISFVFFFLFLLTVSTCV